MRKILLMCAVCASIAVMATEGALSGKFTINTDGDQVFFSKGNLQYDTTNNIWSFAKNQYDMIGLSNGECDTMDLFGWGTGANPTTKVLCEVFNDWGANAISNGGNEANLWRTLTIDEWAYLFAQRPNASSLMGLATIGGHTPGLVLMPDNWTGSGFTASIAESSDYRTQYYYYHFGEGDHYEDNTYTIEQWEALEAQGAVFLPAAGIVSNDVVQMVHAVGDYWTSTSFIPESGGGKGKLPAKRIGASTNATQEYLNAYVIQFDDNSSFSGHIRELDTRMSVRLVQSAPKSDATGIEGVQSTENRVQKVIRDGKVLLLRGNKTYNTQGQQVR